MKRKTHFFLKKFNISIFLKDNLTPDNRQRIYLGDRRGLASALGVFAALLFGVVTLKKPPSKIFSSSFSLSSEKRYQVENNFIIQRKPLNMITDNDIVWLSTVYKIEFPYCDQLFCYCYQCSKKSTKILKISYFKNTLFSGFNDSCLSNKLFSSNVRLIATSLLKKIRLTYWFSWGLGFVLCSQLINNKQYTELYGKFAYCYHSVNVISQTLHKSDHIQQY